jgi:methionine-gamma-lyase
VSAGESTEPILGFQTRCCHGGDHRDRSGHVATPIYLSSNFAFPSAAEGARRAVDMAADEFYGRWGSINGRELEALVASLEHADDAICCSSGLATVALLLHTFLAPGDHFLGSHACYAETLILQKSLCGQMGIATTFVDATDLDALAASVRPDTKLVFLESPANPALSLTDIAAAAELVHSRSDAIVVVDSTFATPFNQNPLLLGADVVVHSATKYLGGHSDVVAGVAAGRAELVTAMRERLSFHGSQLDPFGAWLLCRGLRTLGLRMERQNASALALAEFLRDHPSVAVARYPFLPEHPQHALARTQMRGGGGVVSFDVRGGDAVAARILEHLSLITMTVSLGAVTTLITHPASMTHNLMSLAERSAAGITEGMMRISVGLEEAGDLQADLAHAFQAAEQAAAVA